jgi:uncharacterized membrane protein YdcZ (DUF606 family)
VAGLPARAGRHTRAALRYLGKTIALILGFVGLKILFADLVLIGDLGTLVVIALLIGGGIVASLVADRLDSPHPAEEAKRRPPRCPQELTPRDLQHSTKSGD